MNQESLYVVIVVKINKGEIMGALLGGLATKILSQKVMIAILLKLGDWLVARSENKLDDKVWVEVKKALNG